MHWSKISADFGAAGAEMLTLRGMAVDIEQRRAGAVENLAEAEATLSRATTNLAAIERQAAQAQAHSVTLTRSVWDFVSWRTRNPGERRR